MVRIKVIDRSITTIATGDDIFIRNHDGRIQYDLYFRCTHDRAIVVTDSHPFAEVGVYCPDCDNWHLTDNQREDILIEDMEREALNVK